MSEYRANFVAVSVELTGFEAIDLESTGLVDEYATLCLDILRASDNADQYLQGLQRIVDADDPGAAIPVALDDAFMGFLLRNIAALWYLGEWVKLPSSWYGAVGQPAIDTNTIPSLRAYEQAFAWRVAGAHPPGTRPTGYGGWSLPPVGVVEVAVRPISHRDPEEQ